MAAPYATLRTESVASRLSPTGRDIPDALDMQQRYRNIADIYDLNPGLLRV